MLTFKHFVHRFLDAILLALGRRFHMRSLPSYFNGTWVRFSVQGWRSISDRYESYMAIAIRDNLRRGDVFVDVGAHFGLWSVFAARIVGKTGAVFAFEPSAAFNVLKENASLNPPLEPFNIGLGAEDGTASFFGQGKATSGSLVHSVTQINQKYQPSVPITKIQIKIRSLDSIFAEIGVTPNVIKVDVEGFEYEVLRGAVNLIRTARPLWVVEIHPPQLKLSGSSEEAVLDFFKSNDYATEVIDRNPNSLYTVLAKAQERIKKVA